MVAFTNSGVPGGVYTYRVKATSTVGDSGYSNSTDATITDPPPPGRPLGPGRHRRGQPGGRSGWTDDANNETGFKIERKLTGDPDTSFAQVGTTGANVATFTNTGVPGGGLQLPGAGHQHRGRLALQQHRRRGGHRPAAPGRALRD